MARSSLWILPGENFAVGRRSSVKKLCAVGSLIARQCDTVAKHLPYTASFFASEANAPVMTKTSNASEASFSDPCYPPELVDFINATLDRKDLNATEQWYLICEAEHYMHSHRDAPGFKGLPYQLSLETAPREFILMLIRARRTRGYKRLMKAFGVAVWCH